MTGAKIFVLGVVAQSMAGPIDPSSPWMELLKAGGITAVLLGAAVVFYRDGKRREEKMDSMLDRLTEAQKEHAVATLAHVEATREQSDALHRMATATNEMLRSCREARGLPVMDPQPIVMPKGGRG